MLLACCFREPKSKKSSKKRKFGNYEKINNLETINKLPKSNTKSKPSSKVSKNKEIKDGTYTSFGENLEKSLGSLPSINYSEYRSHNATIIHPGVSDDLERMFASEEDLEGSLLSSCSNEKTYDRKSGSNISLSNKKRTSLSSPDLNTTLHCGLSPQDNGRKKQDLGNQSSEQSLIEIRSSQVLEKNDDAESLVSKIKADFEENINKLKAEHEMILKNEKEAFNRALQEERDSHEKAIEIAVTKAKNEANEVICQMNKQIVNERAKMFAEHQENSKNVEQEFRLKEERLNQSLNLLNQSLSLIEQREQEWQEEKSFYMKEVERLKNDTCSLGTTNKDPKKNRNDENKHLNQEISSLQLVVEMRTGELKSLKKELANANMKLADYELVTEKLMKAKAKIEDLQEQLDLKSEKEKQLHSENCNMETNLNSMSKELERMKKNVETMQWSIRNKFDLPLQRSAFVTCEQQTQIQHETTRSRTSLPTSFVTTDRFSTWKQKSIEIEKEQQVVSPSVFVLKKENEEISGVNQNHEAVEENRDQDSHDEGVEDISSDVDHLNSPSEHSMLTNDDLLRKTCDTKLINPPQRRMSKSSPSEERIPSRFSFGK